MPQRKVILARDEIYHIFNRGVARAPIFSAQSDFTRFINLINYYHFTNVPVSFSNFNKLPSKQREEIFSAIQLANNKHIEIIAFCLMNNHYHFLIKQITDRGISNSISRIQNAYAKYYNMKHDRIGPLFQPMFKAVRIETDEQLLHVSRYIHLNPSTDYLVSIKDLHTYKWSSLPMYVQKGYRYPFVSTHSIMELTKNFNNYQKFVYEQASYQRELAKIKHLLFE